MSKFVKMNEIINGLKQIKTRVDSGTINTVNVTETLLSKQLASMLDVAINYTRCCDELVCPKCGCKSTFKSALYNNCNRCDASWLAN